VVALYTWTDNPDTGTAKDGAVAAMSDAPRGNTLAKPDVVVIPRREVAAGDKAAPGMALDPIVPSVPGTVSPFPTPVVPPAVAEAPKEPAKPAEPKKDQPAPDAKKKAPPPPKEDKPAAPPKETPATPSTSGAAADVKAGTGISKREPVGEAESFTAGTKVWAWSSITGAKDQTVKHVWKKDGKVLWEKEITVTSGRYRTWTRRTVKAGSYTVEVQSADGEVLGSVSFTVS
jgi:outer membrane biosynthesis protein TonB